MTHILTCFFGNYIGIKLLKPLLQLYHILGMDELSENHTKFNELENSPQIEIVNKHILESVVPPEITHMVTEGDGVLRKDYKLYMQTRLLKKDGMIGEVEIPEKLKSIITSGRKLKIFSINMGLGHGRIQEHIKEIAEILGIEVECYFIGGKSKYLSRLLEGIERAALDAYTQYSIKNAIKSEMYKGEDSYIAERNIYRTILDTLLTFAMRKKLTANDYHQFMTGNMNASSPEEIEKSYQFGGKILRKLCGKLWRDDGDKNKTSYLFTHPIFAAIHHSLYKASSDPSAALLVTDLHAEPSWIVAGNQNLKTIVATKETQDALSYYWGVKDPNRINDMIPNINGFHTPASGFLSTELNEKRAQNLKNGDPITLIMTASGVAPTQQTSFESTILQMQKHIEDGKMQVIIQCGYGKPGEMLKNSLEKFLSDKPELAKRVCLHWAEDPMAAIGFFSAISWSEKPIALAVKASEMIMAVNLKIPILITGAVGLQECGNTYQAAKEKSSMILSESVGKKVISGYEEYIRNSNMHPFKKELLIESMKRRIGDRLVNDEVVYDIIVNNILTPYEYKQDRQAMLNALTIALEVKT